MNSKSFNQNDSFIILRTGFRFFGILTRRIKFLLEYTYSMFITSRLTPQNILHPARQTPTEASAILCLKHVVKPIITQGQVSMMQQGIHIAILLRNLKKRN